MFCDNRFFLAGTKRGISFNRDESNHNTVVILDSDRYIFGNYKNKSISSDSFSQNFVVYDIDGDFICIAVSSGGIMDQSAVDVVCRK